MSEPKPPGKIAQVFSTIVKAPAKVLRLSLPAHAAIFTAIFLLVLVTWVWVAFFTDPANIPRRHLIGIWDMLLVLLLVVIIPFVEYRALRLWLEGDVSQFPDLDYAWKAGVDALKRSGIALDSTPLFLVLGSSGDASERAIMDATAMNFRVRGVPQGPAPLHWYANPDGVYLFCGDASWLSTLAVLTDRRIHESTGLAAGPAAPGEDPVASVEPAEPGEAESSMTPMPPAEESGDVGRGTIMLDQFQASTQASAGASTGAPAPAADSTRGTMMLQAPLADLRAPAAPSAAPRGALVAASTGAEEFAVVLAPQDSAEQLQRLTYVCQLLRQARRPLCGINGVLTLLPFAAIDAGAAQAEELQRAVKSDLTTLQRALGLRCPVTALVTGLENERGFRELVRRVGRERARAQRFGRRFDVRSEATAAELAALCIHVCGAFEDWAYTLFREEGALTRPGNTRLYGLLCKVRCHLKTRLSQLLAAGFGRDERAAATDDPIEFSGCYFAATGPTEDRQAFVRGVFDKLVAEQEFVEWTRGALARDARYLWLAYAGMAASAGLLVSLAWMIAARWVS